MLDPAVSVPQTWTERVTRRNHRRVGHPGVAARVWMPESGAHSPVRPAVRSGAAGRYDVESIVLSESGGWNVALVVEGPACVDSLPFYVVLPR